MDLQADSNPGAKSVVETSCPQTTCDSCGKHSATLKRCAGCKASWYCSEACQSAAWPAHKKACKSRSRAAVPAIYAPLGCATLAELVHEAQLWLQTHRFALTMITNALVAVGGGVDAALHPRAHGGSTGSCDCDSSTPRVVVFNLGPPLDYDGTPATAFTLESLSLDDPCRASHAGPDPQWAREIAATTFEGAGVDAVLAGMIPATVCVDEAPWETSPQTAFPLCRPQRAAGGGEGEGIDERMRGTLRNVMRMCTGGINAGIVLHMPQDPSRAMPEMGKVVRVRSEGESWVWAPHDRDVLMSTGPDGMPRGLAIEFLRYFDPGLSPDPVDCFETYHRLWPYHTIRDAAMRGVEVHPELGPYILTP